MRDIDQQREFSEIVFVYGSLKRGFRHHDQMRDARFVSVARLFEYHLILYEDEYPALVKSGEGSDDEVLGELFLVTPLQLIELDRFEDCPRLYQRTRVRMSDGREAWAYGIEARIAKKYQRISGGDYRG